MSKGIWSAVSGSLAQSQRMEVTANNLANVNTTGFKRDEASFRKVLSNAEAAIDKEDIPRKLYQEKDFYKLDGRDKAYVVVDEIATDFSQGRLKITNNPLDVAVNGPGFFEVLTPQGVRYTRNGSFQLSANGTLVNSDGNPVLSPAPPLALDDEGNPLPGQADPTTEEILARAITLEPSGAISIANDGTISRGAQVLGQLSVVEFVDPKLMTKEGSSLYRNDILANILPVVNQSAVKQGAIEVSNVNAVKELTNMLKATRLFEANQNLVRSYGDLEAAAVRDIGKL